MHVVVLFGLVRVRNSLRSSIKAPECPPSLPLGAVSDGWKGTGELYVAGVALEYCLIKSTSSFTI